MTRRLPLSLAIAACCLALAACQREAAPADTAMAPATPVTVAAAPAASSPGRPDAQALEQLADRLVANAGLAEGEVVLVSGNTGDAELVEDIAVAARKVGAFPLVTYASDRLAKRMFFDVPEKYDSQTNALAMKLAGIVDAMITLGNSPSEDLFAGADPRRMAARGKAAEPVNQAMLKRNVRTVEVGNNLYPTSWRAERYGMSQDDLAKVFWEGVNLDYSTLEKRGSEVKAVLAGGDTVHVTHPNGTDFTVRTQGRPVLVSDGVISAEDRKAGGASNAVYLPAGEVYTTPVPGTANGTVVDSRSWFQGKQIDNLKLTFKDGKLVSMDGSGPGFADFKAAYEAVDDARKTQFGVVDLGINPNIKLPANSTVGNWVPAGTVTLGVGANAWAGGDNSVPWATFVSLQGATVTLDDKPIIEGGELKI